jgi:integrase
MARRERGTGSVYQRKDGSWVAQYEGTYRYAKTEKEARRKLRQLLRSTADEVKPTNITVGTALEDYLESARQSLKPRTVIRYQVAIDVHLLPAFGTVMLHKLTALQIEKVYARKLIDGSAPASIQLLHTVLSSAVKRAVRLKLVQTNVCSDVQTPKIQRDEVEVFHPSEVQRILSAAEYARLRAVFVLALTTGMREGELLGLQVDDYVPGRGTLDIRRSVYNGLVGTPKSKRSRRSITLPKLARAALEAHIRATTPSTYIFSTRTGRSFNASHFICKHWKPLLERAGVPYKNFHTCRHYVASTLLSKGLPITVVARYMGHDEKTLLSTYSHLMPDMMDTVAAAMDETLG